MKMHSFIMAAMLIGMLPGGTSCTNNRIYEYVYLHEVTLDNIDVDEDVMDIVVERFEATGLKVLTTRKEARALTAKQKMATLKIDINIDHKRNNIDADLDIENYQSNRDLYETECKCPLNDPEAFEKALDKVIERGVSWIERTAN